jgi:DUF177 domain-containing protein
MEAIDVRDLLARPGSSRELHLAPRMEGLRTELAEVPSDAPVQIDVLLESLVEGILVSGPIWGTITYWCARCLRSFREGFHLEVTELFARGASEDDDEYPLVDGAIDLEQMIRDNVLLSMPFAPLCRPDCLGLCERCGGDRNLGECSCPPRSDPRWGALLSLEID